MTTDQLQKITSQVRRDIVRMVHAHQRGHPGGSLGCADFVTTLYFNVMHHQPSPFSMDGNGEDLFFLPTDISLHYGTACLLEADIFR